MGKNENNNFQDIQNFAKRETLAFAKEHQGEDTTRLLLSASRYPSIDMHAAVQQIEGLRVAHEKWPSLLQYNEFLYPPKLNREQSSSEATAEHKAHLADELCGDKAFVTVADLTGGMGIDSIMFAQRGKIIHPQNTQVHTHVDYVERDAGLCSLMEHNRQVLGLENITVNNCDCIDWLSTDNRHYDIIYIDPARRSSAGRKVSAFEDCEPNILEHMPLLCSHCRWLIVKASPMIDLSLAQRQLGEVAEVHIVSVKGECKEVLFVCGCHEGEIVVHCIVKGHGEFYDIDFTQSQEAEAVPSFASEVEDYLYEPSPSLMKGGCYNSLCRWFGIKKLARNTHLYTDNRYHEDFPGRVFQVMQPLTLNAKEAKRAIPEGKAHVVVRNYPVAANELQKKLGLREGGELFVIATTLGQRRLGWLCKMV